MSATATESKQFSNISANAGPFPLKGGRYVLIASGTITGLQLQIQSLDGSTWINLGTDMVAAGNQTFDLPPGQYQLSVSGSAIYASLTSVPT
jgi:hypothetical protein